MKNNINSTTQDLHEKLQIRRKTTAVVKKTTREKYSLCGKLLQPHSHKYFLSLKPQIHPKY